MPIKKETLGSKVKDVTFPKHPVLVVDDDETALGYYQVILESNGIDNIILSDDSRNVLQIIEGQELSVISLDLRMPFISGKELLEIIREWHPETPVLIITGTAEVEIAVECMKIGAFDYLMKPVEESRLIATIRHAIEINELKHEVNHLSQHMLSKELENPEAFSEIITDNKDMMSIFRYIEAVAPSSKPVLITGESGVGKELFANVIHHLSNNRGEFVPVNVAGLDDTLFHDTLFGHKKGAYTGADSNRQGLIEQATGGTLFLDEIGDLQNSSQVKLLRLLQEKEYYQLGSDERRTSDTRIVAATNVDLEEKIKTNKFRNDLFYRLHTHYIRIPPLRERLDDIPLLTDYFIEEACETLEKKVPTVPHELYTLLATYEYPGNVRELQSMVFDAISRHEAKMLSLSVFKNYISERKQNGEIVAEITQPDQKSINYSGAFPTLKEVEDFFIDEALKKAEGNQSIAARLLGVSQSTLSRRMKKDG